MNKPEGLSYQKFDPEKKGGYRSYVTKPYFKCFDELAPAIMKVGSKFAYPLVMFLCTHMDKSTNLVPLYNGIGFTFADTFNTSIHNYRKLMRRLQDVNIISKPYRGTAIINPDMVYKGDLKNHSKAVDMFKKGKQDDGQQQKG